MDISERRVGRAKTRSAAPQQTEAPRPATEMQEA
jgi:hypothetical protein